MITKKLLLDNHIVQLDNEYLDLYVELINSNLNKPKEKYKTQIHHIIPKYYFKDLNIPVDNSKNNLINLDYKDHIKAHYYLYKCSTGKYKYSNSTVLKLSIKNKLIFDDDNIFNFMLDNEILDIIQEGYEYSIKIESDKQGEHYKKRLASLTSSDTRKKMSESQRKLYASGYRNPSWDLPNPNLGTKHYNNGKINIYAKECPEGFDEGFLLADSSREKMGWSKGLTGDRFNTTGGTITINNGINNKHILPEELQQYLSTKQWVIGKLPCDTGKWYTNGKENTKIPNGNPIPEGFYPGKIGLINNKKCSCIINDQLFEFNSKNLLADYLFSLCTNNKWSSPKFLLQYINRKNKQNKPIYLELNNKLTEIKLNF